VTFGPWLSSITKCFSVTSPEEDVMTTPESENYNVLEFNSPVTSRSPSKAKNSSKVVSKSMKPEDGLGNK
jgi:hypothetical protein